MERGLSLLSDDQVSYLSGRLSVRAGTRALLGKANKPMAMGVGLGDYFHNVTRQQVGIALLPQSILYGDTIRHIIDEN